MKSGGGLLQINVVQLVNGILHPLFLQKKIIAADFILMHNTFIAEPCKSTNKKDI